MTAATLAKIGAVPWRVGSTVDVPGHGSAVVWSAGPLPASAWAALEGDTSRMLAVKLPTPRRAAYVLEDATRAALLITARERLRTSGVLISVEAATPYGTERGTSVHLATCERVTVGHVATIVRERYGRAAEHVPTTTTAVLARGSREHPLNVWHTPPACCCPEVTA